MGKLIPGDVGLTVYCCLSGAVGGDQQISGMMARGKVEVNMGTIAVLVWSAGG